MANINIENNFIILQRGRGKVLLYAGHQFYKHQTYRNNSTHWRCAGFKLEKSRRCYGSVTISEDQSIIKDINHNQNCLMDKTKNIVDMRIAEAIIEATEGIDPAPKVYDKHIVKIRKEGLDLASNKPIPLFRNKKATIYRKRNKLAQVKRVCPQSIEDIEVPAQFHEFLVADYYDGNVKILIFCSNQANNEMKTIKNYFMDGTFQSCPLPLAQLYTIQGDLGSNSHRDMNIIPLIYAFMSHRSERAYSILFDLITTRMPNWNPKEVRIDFEAATLKVLKKMKVKTKGCLYHFTECLRRKAKKIGCFKSKLQKRIIQLCCSLPFLPVKDIESGWCFIQNEIPEDPALVKFKRYFSNYWMKPELVKIWSVFGDEYRTTNVVEGWNHKMNTLLNKNPNMLQVLHVLKNDSKLNS